jgi:thiamine-phosphate pyrophosphorylase
MSDVLCVTSRRLCRGDFLTRIGEIAACAPSGIILREKDLSEADYELLSRRVLEICGRMGVPCILHSFTEAAIRLKADKLHLPLPLLRKLGTEERAHFTVLGASCHSVEEAQEAQHLGCTYITAGHIFATDCKRGLPPRGTDFLRQVCESVQIPVYAIGGISRHELPEIRTAGARGVCVMSGAMTCEDIKKYMEDMKESEKAGGVNADES